MKQLNWKGKNVLVTGGDGFIASHLVKRLQELSANVIITARHRKSKDSLDLINNIYKSHPVVEYTDLLSLEEANRILTIHEIDTVFHLAATSVVVAASDSPYWALKNNILTTMNVLEASRVNGVKRIIIASSDKAYGDVKQNDTNQKLPYREHYDLRGIDVYSVSKLCSDSIAQSYASQYDMPIIISRSCNVYGPGDLNFSRIIPRTIIRLMNNLPPEINLGNHNVLREYCYIDDVVDAYLCLAKNISYSLNGTEKGVCDYGCKAYNIGNYNHIDSADLSKYTNIKSAESIIKQISELYRIKIEPKLNVPTTSYIEIGNQYNDSSKLFQLGYKPKHTLDDGLRETIKWYSEHKSVCDKIALKYLN